MKVQEMWKSMGAMVMDSEQMSPEAHGGANGMQAWSIKCRWLSGVMVDESFDENTKSIDETEMEKFDVMIEMIVVRSGEM